ncbi:MAG: flagellar assembly regulator FliX, partial [Afipia sp.]|nr:flagellar assembly regulator FliX [Afipia sp.]
LRTAAADLKASSGDPGLDQVLSEIELRVEVELAKAGQ